MLNDSNKGDGYMAIEVFNRCEKKYILDEKTYNKFLVRLSDHMVLDGHNADNEFYSISNIYYDTRDDSLIRNSIEKPVYKEKLRVRSYGVPSIEDSVYVEIKKKYKGIVNKRRTSLVLSEAYDYLDNDICPDLNQNKINQQVFKEIDYFKHFYDLVPKVHISYDRRAYFEKNDGDFRLTFDTNIRARRENVRLEAGNYGELLLNEGQFLMEVKITNAAPIWFTKLMSEMKIYPVSFSKYGTEYTRYIKNMIIKGEQVCFNQYLQRQQLTQFQLAQQC